VDLMNVNIQRIDNGAKLTEAELDAAIWNSRRAQPAEAATDLGAEQAPRRSWVERRAPSRAAALAVFLAFLASGFLVGTAIRALWLMLPPLN
jgi:hypothetical protein